MNTTSTIGFVGLGAMGSRIAGRLLDAIHDVYGTNRTRSKSQPLIDRGLVWLDTPREVAATADIVFSMVTDDQALEAFSEGLLDRSPSAARASTKALEATAVPLLRGRLATRPDSCRYAQLPGVGARCSRSRLPGRRRAGR
jgi:3-hydroxyisobutyrate dehydrogenase-like beta-hydroxyacid dehydrogenase